MNKMHIILSQFFVTFILLATMSGPIGLVIVGPIAFIFTLFAWPASMGPAGQLLEPRQDKVTAEA